MELHSNIVLVLNKSSSALSCTNMKVTSIYNFQTSPVCNKMTSWVKVQGQLELYVDINLHLLNETSLKHCACCQQK